MTNTYEGNNMIWTSLKYLWKAVWKGYRCEAVVPKLNSHKDCTTVLILYSKDIKQTLHTMNRGNLSIAVKSLPTLQIFVLEIIIT